MVVLISQAYMINRESYMSVHALLNLFNTLRKSGKCEACRAFYSFFATILINSMIYDQEHKIRFYLSYGTKTIVKLAF